MKRKLIATLLVLSLVMTLAPLATIFASADTASEDVVTVSDADALLGFAQDLADGETFAGKTISITADIDMSEKTWPDLSAANFSGVIDGNGNVVSGITATTAIFGNLQPVADFTVGVKDLAVADSTAVGAGLFTAILAGGNVEFNGLALDIDVTGTKNVATIAATSAAEEVLVLNTTVSGTITATGIQAAGFFGHVVNTVSMAGCVFDGTIACSASETWGNTATGGFIALAGGKILGTEAANVAGIVTINRSAFYGTIAMGGANVGKIGVIVGNTNGGDNSFVTIEEVIVAGAVNVSGKLMYNNGLLIGIGASTSSGTYNNAVSAMTGTIASADNAAHTDLANWPWAGKSGSATAYSLTNNLVVENLESLVFTSGEITVDLSAYFEIAEEGALPLPKAVDGIEIPEPTPDITTINVATADELIAGVQAIADGETYEYTIIKLTADIDVTDKTWPALNAATFSGLLDGDGHTISGFAVSNTEGSASIFGNLQPVAGFAVGVQNLTIKDSVVVGTDRTAGLFNTIKAGGEVVLSNLYIDIDVTSQGTFAAAIASTSAATVAVDNVVVAGSVYGVGLNVAGMFGNVYGTMTIDNSLVTAYVKTDAVETWGNTPIAGYIAQVGLKVSDSDKRPGNVTVTNSAFYGTLELTSEGAINKFAGIIANTQGGNTSDVVTMENVIVAGYLKTVASTMYDYNNGVAIGIGASGSTVNLNNVVGGLIHNDTEAIYAQIIGKGATQTITNTIVTAVPAEITSLVFTSTDDTDPENPVTTTVTLTDYFTIVDGVALPNDVVALYAAANPAPETPETPDEPGEDEGDNTTEPAPGTTEPAPGTTEPAPGTTEPAPGTTEPAAKKKGCKSVVASAAGILFASIMAGAVCLGKRKED